MIINSDHNETCSANRGNALRTGEIDVKHLTSVRGASDSDRWERGTMGLANSTGRTKVFKTVQLHIIKSSYPLTLCKPLHLSNTHVS